MRKFQKLFAAVALTVAVAGCAGIEKDTAAGMTPDGSAFNQALYAEYLRRSQVEYAEGDYRNSDLLAVKAQWAAGGAFVVPEKVEDHALPAGSNRFAIQLGRSRLWPGDPECADYGPYRILGGEDQHILALEMGDILIGHGM